MTFQLRHDRVVRPTADNTAYTAHFVRPNRLTLTLYMLGTFSEIDGKGVEKSIERRFK